jgi:hypothetical protein
VSPLAAKNAELPSSNALVPAHLPSGPGAEPCRVLWLPADSAQQQAAPTLLFQSFDLRQERSLNFRQNTATMTLQLRADRAGLLYL